MLSSKSLQIARVTAAIAILFLLPDTATSSQERPQTPVPATETATAPEPVRLKESVEVTATRGAIDAIASPASSTVVLRSDIERRNVVTVDQALTAVEGVYDFRQRGAADNEMGVGMRGFSGRASGQSRVLVLLDGQPLNNSYSGAVNWTALSLTEVDRVEVARGPFSSLYGGSAMGGVINIISRPIDTRSLEVNARYGTHDSVLASTRGGIRLGRVGLGASYESLTSGGYPTQEVLRTATDSTPTGGIPVSGVVRYLTRTGTVNYAVGLRGNNTYDRYNARARAEYTFSPTTFGSFQYIRQSGTFAWDPYTTWVKAVDGGQPLDAGNIVFQDNGVWKRATLTPSNYLGVVIGGASDLYQAQVLRSDRTGEWRAQAGVLDAPSDYTTTPGAAATLAGGAGNYSLQENRGAYANVQWSKPVVSAHRLTVGLDLRQDRASVQTFTASDYINVGVLSPRETFATGKAATWAMYAQDVYTASERLSITFGARFDDWRTFDGASQKAANLATDPFAERSDAAVTGKVAATFRAAEGTIIRSSFGSAFRSPTVFDLYRDTRLSSGSLLLGNASLDPERMTSWEIGLRQSAGRQVSADVAYYHNDIRNLIFRALDLTLDPNGLTSRNLNAGRAHTNGVELALTVRHGAWLVVRPTYTYTDPVISENIASPLSVGKQIPFVPRHVAAGTATVTLPKVTVTGTARYQSAVFATDTNTDTTKEVPGSYDKFFETDVAATYQLHRRVSVNVSCENILDTHYYLFYRNPGRILSAGLRLKY